jgi:hypothetical protein
MSLVEADSAARQVTLSAAAPTGRARGVAQFRTVHAPPMMAMSYITARQVSCRDLGGSPVQFFGANVGFSKDQRRPPSIPSRGRSRAAAPAGASVTK